MTKTLRVDMNELEEAVELGGFHYVLDTESGKRTRYVFAPPNDAYLEEVDD